MATIILVTIIIYHCVSVIYSNEKKDDFLTSIAIYITIGANQKLKKDFRGKFWETQLPNPHLDCKIHYVSDAPFKINNITKCLVPKSAYIDKINDKIYCQRTFLGWEHFLIHHKEIKWYFRGIHDTFLNLTNLADLLKNIEKTHDPMKEEIAVYGAHEVAGNYYPQGGGGFLLSHGALKKLYKYKNEFHQICPIQNDDLALGVMLESFLGINISENASDRFIATWPYEFIDEILTKNYTSFVKCPQYYRMHYNSSYLKPIRVESCVSFHMHGIDMDVALELLKSSPKNLFVYYTESASPRFCFP
ncbi:hypothetical protein TVAG_175680 [Trichomonas vaginalis G3]|uniref:N-acetylgalactosaminide beta-1,3-galactosyltransferase n=1 Tax=Trichomonas vaginalis (strain ATCC PRA-98 / G3) TaxID=412133 RepID=A2F5N6_TRIV3|nr:beta1,3-galactosyltransferase family [Trichomonas vaginalis G3]EAX99799.1 hypothetical protein TVAG_175680 [Trichomonas vaginalis G3]KAI5494433.1 beta1,3-galactosyltransferase family [Trichomonas vaginalis G3]|eukprot:XP_001312729.1 hypothetical protein [Trichomonas vaginalis G3]